MADDGGQHWGEDGWDAEGGARMSAGVTNDAEAGLYPGWEPEGGPASHRLERGASAHGNPLKRRPSMRRSGRGGGPMDGPAGEEAAEEGKHRTPSWRHSHRTVLSVNS